MAENHMAEHVNWQKGLIGRISSGRNSRLAENCLAESLSAEKNKWQKRPLGRIGYLAENQIGPISRMSISRICHLAEKYLADKYVAEKYKKQKDIEQKSLKGRQCHLAECQTAQYSRVPLRIWRFCWIWNCEIGARSFLEP